ERLAVQGRDVADQRTDLDVTAEIGAFVAARRRVPVRELHVVDRAEPAQYPRPYAGVARHAQQTLVQRVTALENDHPAALYRPPLHQSNRTRSSSQPRSCVTATRSCCIVSRSRTVTVWFSRVSASIVMQYGVPISSWRRYRLPTDAVSS